MGEVKYTVEGMAFTIRDFVRPPPADNEEWLNGARLMQNLLDDNQAARKYFEEMIQEAVRTETMSLKANHSREMEAMREAVKTTRTKLTNHEVVELLARNPQIRHRLKKELFKLKKRPRELRAGCFASDTALHAYKREVKAQYKDKLDEIEIECREWLRQRGDFSGVKTHIHGLTPIMQVARKYDPPLPDVEPNVAQKMYEDLQYKHKFEGSIEANHAAGDIEIDGVPAHQIVVMANLSPRAGEGLSRAEKAIGSSFTRALDSTYTNVMEPLVNHQNDVPKLEQLPKIKQTSPQVTGAELSPSTHDQMLKQEQQIRQKTQQNAAQQSGLLGASITDNNAGPWNLDGGRITSVEPGKQVIIIASSATDSDYIPVPSDAHKRKPKKDAGRVSKTEQPIAKRQKVQELLPQDHVSRIETVLYENSQQQNTQTEQVPIKSRRTVTLVGANQTRSAASRANAAAGEDLRLFVTNVGTGQAARLLFRGNMKKKIIAVNRHDAKSFVVSFRTVEDRRAAFKELPGRWKNPSPMVGQDRHWPLVSVKPKSNLAQKAPKQNQQSQNTQSNQYHDQGPPKWMPTRPRGHDKRH
ncbi:hypothetical protein B0O99DRAFT_587998 [Bisporella sp. PMI_857]|nr:hypothetical protein B0O99DRAFT_587998 [Bisporella sp. PMI_857]